MWGLQSPPPAGYYRQNLYLLQRQKKDKESSSYFIVMLAYEQVVGDEECHFQKHGLPYFSCPMLLSVHPEMEFMEVQFR
jgi:hypothetical protein